MTEIITDLPRELRDKGWVILPKGNALRACNFRWGMESSLYALPGRAWAKKKGLSEAERRAVPAGLVEWVQQATDDVRPVLEALEAVITSAEERDRLQPRFIYSGPGRVRIVVSVAYFDWQIEPAGGAWRIASTLKRLAPVVLPADLFPVAWLRLADLHIAYNRQANLEIQTVIANELQELALVELDARDDEAGESTAMLYLEIEGAGVWELEAAIISEDIGAITGSGGGVRSRDLHIEVDDTTAIDRIRALAAAYNVTITRLEQID